MAVDPINNLAFSPISGTYSDSDTDITVNDSSVFPTSGNFEVTMFNVAKSAGQAFNDGEAEIGLVTNNDTGTNTLTLTRGQGGTSAITLGSGTSWVMVQSATKRIFDQKANLTGGNAFSGVQDFTGRIDADSGISFDGGTNVFDEYKKNTSWTPSHAVTASTNPSVGGGTSPAFSGSYWVFDKLLIGTIDLDFDDSSSVTEGDRWEISGLPRSSVGDTFITVGSFNILKGFTAGNMAYGQILASSVTDRLYFQVTKKIGTVDYTGTIHAYFKYIIQ